MIEYRLKEMPEKLLELLEEIGAFVAEEEFYGENTYLFYSEDNLDDILSLFNVEYSCKNVLETGWQDKWKEYIKEGWLNKSIYYIFEEKTFDDNRKTILINPALAFGTGAHGTTKIAANLMENICSGRSFLDIGTGSGILSIAASILGAKNVFAFDIDEVAMNNCRENINNNNISNITIWAGDVNSINTNVKYNIVCANIISSVLLNIVDVVKEVASDYIIFSGILQSEYVKVINNLVPKGWSIDEKIEIDEWCGVRLINDSRNR